MQTAGRIAYEPTVALLRGSGRRAASRTATNAQSLSFVEHTHLRMIWTGSVRTQERLFKANSVASPLCIWCSLADETVHHLFWECPAWHEQRIITFHFHSFSSSRFFAALSAPVWHHATCAY